MVKKTVTLKILRKDTLFVNLYLKFLEEDCLSEFEYSQILSVAIVLINSKDEINSRLGYRIIVLYTIKTGHTTPLYDVAINQGYYPLVSTLESAEPDLSFDDKNDTKISFWRLIQKSFIESFNDGSKYLTFEQFQLNSMVLNTENRFLSIVAPTSYGKSEIIISMVKEKANICILVPTKALIAQTKRRLYESETARNCTIITHPDMYTKDRNFVAVLTQERLLKLLHEQKSLEFDIIFVDEAHNLLESDSRKNLLAQSLIIANNRSLKTKFLFLTPFLLNSDNLRLKFIDNKVEEMRVTEYVKTERIYLAEFRDAKDRSLRLYDQFLNDFIELEAPKSKLNDFIRENAGNQNIIYFNTPVKIEKFVKNFISDMSEIDDEELKKSCEHLKNFLHPSYLLIKALKRGVIYHHGSIPDNIKQYVEYIFRNNVNVKFIVTNSTLLEGVNLPADKLFVLSKSRGRGGLKFSHFKNLIGRIKRFNKIFRNRENLLDGLSPQIYMIASDYASLTERFDNYLKNNLKEDKKYNEVPENVLLSNTKVESEKAKKEEKGLVESLECLEPGVTGVEGVRVPVTDVGKLCLLNNINEFNVLEKEKEIDRKVQSYIDNKRVIWDVEELLELINELFISEIDESNRPMSRLLNQYAIKFYTFFMTNKMKGTPYFLMINKFFNYWKKGLASGRRFIHVGKWGDFNKENPNIDSYRHWVDLTHKSDSDIINYAILRIKEENDFVDYTYMRFIEVLNDLKILDKDLYTSLKYGTTNKVKITMIKNGLSHELIKLIREPKYKGFWSCDVKSNTVAIDKNIVDEMKENKENELLIVEASYVSKY